MLRATPFSLTKAAGVQGTTRKVAFTVIDGSSTSSPAAPKNVAATLIGTSGIKLSWSAPTSGSPVSKYIIDYFAGSNTPMQSTHVAGSATSVSLSGLSSFEVYSIYVIAVRRSPTARGKVTFRGLPAHISAGTVLPHGPSNPPRPVGVRSGSFTDASPYEPHNARVYRFVR